jgi:GxxExxY protein
MEDNKITEAVIGCAIKVSKSLGTGFLEKVYENALAYELRKQGFEVEQQKAVEVYYDGIVVGYYNPDILVNGKIIVELKAVSAIDDTHEAQLLNYLRATGLTLGLLLNFGTPKLGIRRKMIWSNESSKV